MVPSSILCGCATPLHLVPRRWAVVLRRVGARQRGRGATVVGCEDSRVRADYTIWRVRTACVGLVFAGLLGWVRGVGEAENRICMVHA